jgi:hypothetical protein
MTVSFRRASQKFSQVDRLSFAFHGRIKDYVSILDWPFASIQDRSFDSFYGAWPPLRVVT